jgi:hypothetical protein
MFKGKGHLKLETMKKKGTLISNFQKNKQLVLSLYGLGRWEYSK